MNTLVSRSLVEDCKSKLISIRADILNRVRAIRDDFSSRDDGGDEGDQNMRALAENEFLVAQERLKAQLLEIDLALGRIESGMFGICEETLEPIEPERLKALPWTRVSIEGAEIREAQGRRYAR